MRTDRRQGSAIASTEEPSRSANQNAASCGCQRRRQGFKVFFEDGGIAGGKNFVGDLTQIQQRIGFPERARLPEACFVAESPER